MAPFLRFIVEIMRRANDYVVGLGASSIYLVNAVGTMFHDEKSGWDTGVSLIVSIEDAYI
jgi:hypothetical protein